jgi:hypothetical protein
VFDINDNVEIVFAHPEAFLGKEGRDLMSSEKFQKNVVACAVDVPCEQSPLVFLLGTARRSERDSAELVYKFI